MESAAPGADRRTGLFDKSANLDVCANCASRRALPRPSTMVLACSPSGASVRRSHSRRDLLQGETAGEAGTASSKLRSNHHRLTLARRAVYVGARSDRGESSKLPRTHINQRLSSRPAQVGFVHEGGLLEAVKPASE